MLVFSLHLQRDIRQPIDFSNLSNLKYFIWNWSKKDLMIRYAQKILLFFPASELHLLTWQVRQKAGAQITKKLLGFVAPTQSSLRSVRYFCQTQLMPIIQKILFLTQFFTFKCSDTRLIDLAILHFFAPVCFFPFKCRWEKMKQLEKTWEAS